MKEAVFGTLEASIGTRDECNRADEATLATAEASDGTEGGIFGTMEVSAGLTVEITPAGDMTFGRASTFRGTAGESRGAGRGVPAAARCLQGLW
jgi:hypothetical protein